MKWSLLDELADFYNENSCKFIPDIDLVEIIIRDLPENIV